MTTFLALAGIASMGFAFVLATMTQQTPTAPA
jgi:hypothetical protein